METLRVIRENSEIIKYNKWFSKPHSTFPPKYFKALLKVFHKKNRIYRQKQNLPETTYMKWLRYIKDILYFKALILINA